MKECVALLGSKQIPNSPSSNPTLLLGLLSMSQQQERVVVLMAVALVCRCVINAISAGTISLNVGMIKFVIIARRRDMLKVPAMSYMASRRVTHLVKQEGFSLLRDSARALTHVQMLLFRSQLLPFQPIQVLNCLPPNSGKQSLDYLVIVHLRITE